MGEIAEMMLEGILCAGCGDFIGEDVGYPVYCQDCESAQEEDVKPEDARLKVEIGHKLYRTLGTAAYTNQGVMYPNGVYWDDASKQFERLKTLGFVEYFKPHNLVHKPRAVITNLGKRYLELNKKKFKNKKK